jgi:hypothetical protein
MASTVAVADARRDVERWECGDAFAAILPKLGGGIDDGTGARVSAASCARRLSSSAQRAYESAATSSARVGPTGAGVAGARLSASATLAMIEVFSKIALGGSMSE